jgi:Fe-S-cluster containining protein
MKKTGCKDPCSSGDKSKECYGIRPSSRQDGPDLDEDRRWMEEHVLGEGDLLLYGRLSEEIDEISPAVMWKELRAVAEKYLACGADRTVVFHRLVDETIDALTARDQRFNYPLPFCHKGCSNCCHELVYCTSEEARHIHDYCLKSGIVIDHAKFERQLRYVETDEHLDHTSVTTWNDQDEADQACVFLDKADGSCTIWPARPLVCRVHLAERTDEYCMPHNGQINPKACGINYIELSYILSAIFTIHRGSIKKTMGRLLLNLKDSPVPPLDSR